MVEITRAKAKFFFDQYKQIIVLPVGVNPVNKGTFMPLYIHKKNAHSDFPAKRVHEYQETIGAEVRYYIDSPKVLIARNGNGFVLTEFETRKHFAVVRGTDNTLIKFINTNCLQVMNKGYLLPQFRNKIKVQTIA